MRAGRTHVTGLVYNALVMPTYSQEIPLNTSYSHHTQCMNCHSEYGWIAIMNTYGWIAIVMDMGGLTQLRQINSQQLQNWTSPVKGESCVHHHFLSPKGKQSQATFLTAITLQFSSQETSTSSILSILECSSAAMAFIYTQSVHSACSMGDTCTNAPCLQTVDTHVHTYTPYSSYTIIMWRGGGNHCYPNIYYVPF